ncbi:hypothetical protein EYF80_044916 [Liparis tanakae]|uniref:Uncharacterized protein n=1 Tax=Liparis tanakae TaxID=230148 RepID=A0A4Z2FUG5_9TELE|nr:hypothetical protein EYF80_044916 [Liparis tanakae]
MYLDLLSVSDDQRHIVQSTLTDEEVREETKGNFGVAKTTPVPNAFLLDDRECEAELSLSFKDKRINPVDVLHVLVFGCEYILCVRRFFCGHVTSGTKRLEEEAAEQTWRQKGNVSQRWSEGDKKKLLAGPVTSVILASYRERWSGGAVASSARGLVFTVTSSRCRVTRHEFPKKKESVRLSCFTGAIVCQSEGG